jgi:bifunctional oligoribonuclease and PAP phosphatase NrnA
MRASSILKASRRIAESQNILILTHERPDGDALGSMLGLTHMLHALGKTVSPVSADGISSVFKFLPGSETIGERLPETYDLCILVDCGDAERIGRLAGSLPRPPDINFDHHKTNSDFAAINIVEPKANATAELLTELAPRLGLRISPDAAMCLLVGVVTDTIGFRVPATNQRTLTITKRLMRAGGSLPEAMERTLHRHSFAAMRYWGAGLSRLERDGDLIWTSLSLPARKAADYPGRDDADLINVLSSIEDARVAMIFVEQEGGLVKISWRAREGLDVTPLASSFGGGGHPAASGATTVGALEEVIPRVVKATREWYRTQTNAHPAPG